jgi:hypothetical protein
MDADLLASTEVSAGREALQGHHGEQRMAVPQQVPRWPVLLGNVRPL